MHRYIFLPKYYDDLMCTMSSQLYFPLYTKWEILLRSEGLHKHKQNIIYKTTKYTITRFKASISQIENIMHMIKLEMYKEVHHHNNVHTLGNALCVPTVK